MSKIAQEHLQEFREIAEAATQSQWTWGSHSEFDLKKSERWIGKMLRHHPHNQELFLVLKDGTEGAPAIALTGNGPDAENNAKYLVMAQPQNVIVLLNELRNSYQSAESLVKAVQILLKARDCLAPNGLPEIPEQISASFDIGLEDAIFISKLDLSA